jgi:S-adenosylmethionine:tRNA ribosyltransferase-isomerase
VEDLTKHKVDSEEMFITQKTADTINKALSNKNNVCAVGTTSMKALESGVSITGKIKPFKGWTNKFIFPPYEFKTANAMITNFHMPMSPMYMMVSAYIGFDFTQKVYKEAIKNKYKFFTYGDAMLII